MKKLLALLLLSPLAFTGVYPDVWEDATESLNLEYLSIFIPNDSYTGFTCEYNSDSRMLKSRYKMFTFSIEEDRGINLLDYEHQFNKMEEYRGCVNENKKELEACGPKHYKDIHHKLHRNSSWGAYLWVSDFYISIGTPGYNSLGRDDLKVETINCKKANVQEMKEFATKVIDMHDKYQKIIDDNYQRKLDKRKL